MSTLRTIIVALLTLAVAALPAAGMSTSVSASDAPQANMQGDCAKHVEASEAEHNQTDGLHAKAGQTKGHCPDHNCCGGKCLCLGLGLTAVLPVASGALAMPVLVEKTARMTDSARSPAYIPPSPPPRV